MLQDDIGTCPVCSRDMFSRTGHAGYYVFDACPNCGYGQDRDERGNPFYGIGVLKTVMEYEGKSNYPSLSVVGMKTFLNGVVSKIDDSRTNPTFLFEYTEKNYADIIRDYCKEVELEGGFNFSENGKLESCILFVNLFTDVVKISIENGNIEIALNGFIMKTENINFDKTPKLTKSKTVPILFLYIIDRILTNCFKQVKVEGFIFNQTKPDGYVRNITYTIKSGQGKGLIMKGHDCNINTKEDALDNFELLETFFKTSYKNLTQQG